MRPQGLEPDTGLTRPGFKNANKARTSRHVTKNVLEHCIWRHLLPSRTAYQNKDRMNLHNMVTQKIHEIQRLYINNNTKFALHEQVYGHVKGLWITDKKYQHLHSWLDIT